MPVRLHEHATATPAAPAGGDAIRRRFARVSIAAAVYSYLLVVFGGIVRITGSGLGCGDDWPLCNGHILPPWDLATWIEWTHRLLAAGLVVPIALVALAAIRHRDWPGISGPRGAGRPALAAIALLVVQVLLGALTVKLDLPAGVTSLHFINALLLIAALLVAGVRAGGPKDTTVDRDAARRFARSATGAVVLGFLTVSFGAFTANTGLVGAQTAPSGAAWACQGFPLCNGAWIPAGESFVHIHWTHRLLAFLLLFHVIGATISAIRRGAPRGVALAALASLALVVAQITVAAGLVLMHLPASMRVLHLVVGAALWMALVVWGTRARRSAAST
jgi:heme A synthase